jgi:hypothetical protein
MLVSTYIALLAKRVHAPVVGEPFIAGVNALARTIDRGSSQLRRPQPGTIFANYHLTAEP